MDIEATREYVLAYAATIACVVIGVALGAGIWWLIKLPFRKKKLTFSDCGTGLYWPPTGECKPTKKQYNTPRCITRDEYPLTVGGCEKLRVDVSGDLEVDTKGGRISKLEKDFAECKELVEEGLLDALNRTMTRVCDLQDLDIETRLKKLEAQRTHPGSRPEEEPWLFNVSWSTEPVSLDKIRETAKRLRIDEEQQCLCKHKNWTRVNDAYLECGSCGYKTKPWVPPNVC